MSFLKRFLEYAIFTNAILLAFLLVFEKFLYVPNLVNWIGHWHPLVLHFPIVLVLITIIQYWRNDKYFDLYLSITTFLTFITATTGFLLSLEGGSKGDLILTHQWLGVAVSYLMAIWFGLNQRSNLLKGLPIIIQGALILLIIATGHFGGMVTHGKDFLAFTKHESQNSTSLPDNPIIFNHVIKPILDKKCVSCHNQNKSKGELILSDFASIMKGGKSGNIIDRHEFENSSLLGRISLPLGDEDHMPPKEEKQLTDDEMTLVSEWVEYGAIESQHFSELEVSGHSYELIKKLIDQSRNNKWNELPEVSGEKLNQLSSNYVRIIRFFNNSNALQVIIYPHKGYNNSIVKDLKPIARNIVELNLSGLPIGDQELDIVLMCVNLEKLNISNTPVKEENIGELTRLKKLKVLKIYNTNLSDDVLGLISELPDLSSLYVYNTGITDIGINEFRETNKDVLIIKSTEEAKGFISVLPSPKVEPGKYFFIEPIKIKLNHPLEGIDLFYTTDGSIPEETSKNARDSLEIEKSTHLKYYASKEGWESSQIDSMRLFKTMVKPDAYKLTNEPDPKYPGSGKDLLFDLKKGPTNLSDSAWMAFNKESFILNCEWSEEKTISSVVLSSMVISDSYLFPPESIVVRGGMEKSSMKVLGRLAPGKLEERSNRYIDFFECQFDPVTVRFIEITVQPLQKIPMWHQGKGKKGWFFIDEVAFLEVPSTPF